MAFIESNISILPVSCVCAPRIALLAGDMKSGQRLIPEETAIAFTYNGSSHAVMMATPADLEDFAVGLSLTEEIVEKMDDISSLEVVGNEFGIELRLWLHAARTQRYSARRRALAGPTGCGLCGVESLSEAVRPARRVRGGLIVTPEEISAAINALPALQVLNHGTRAMHAAAYWQPSKGVVATREDVGRHNALDKLVGTLARRQFDGSNGIVLLTSRISVELVQKTAILGATILVAVSAPTALAVRVAEACGITLVAIARDRDFEIFSHPGRIVRDNVHRRGDDIVQARREAPASVAV